MKNTVSTLILLVVVSSSVVAGDMFGRAQLCLNFSNFSHDSLLQGETTTTATFLSFGIGAESAINAEGNMSILGELWYMSKGGGFSESGSNFGQSYSSSSTYRLSYLQINPMFRYRATAVSNVGICVYGGPGIGVLVGNNSSSTYTYGSISSSSDTSLPNSTFNSLEVSFILGTEAIYPINPTMDVIGGLRYNIGLTNVDNPDDPPGSKEAVMKISAFTVVAGVRIKL